MTVTNYKNITSILPSRCYAKSTSFFSLSYRIFDSQRNNIYNIYYSKNLYNSLTRLSGYKIENLLSREVVYYVDKLITNKLFPNGFYYSNWKPLAIHNVTYFEDIPLNIKECTSLISSIGNNWSATKQILDSYSGFFTGFNGQSEMYPGEMIRSIIIPKGEYPYLICDFPGIVNCKRIIVVRDYNGHKILHLIRNINSSYFNPILIRISQQFTKLDFISILLFSALRALDTLRSELV